MARDDSLWFSFNGARSDDMGARVAALPEIPVAGARGRSVEIPGRDGELWLDDGAFHPVEVRVELEIGGAADADAIAAWLTGRGPLTLSTDPQRYRRARVDGAFGLKGGAYAGGRYRAAVAFCCDPFRYRVGDPAMPPITAPGTFSGDGTWFSRPEITVYGSGDINLMVNGAALLLDDVSDHITVDCDAMMAFRDGVNVSPQVTILSDDDAWPTLRPGVDANAISWTGDVTRVVIQPNWRWR